MRFVTYIGVAVVVDVVLCLALGALFFSLSPAAGALWIVLVVILVIPFTALHFWLLSKRLDDYGGRFPFPGILGLLGVDLTTDGYDQSLYDSFRVSDGAVGARASLVESAPARADREGQVELDADGNPIAFRFHCPYCHAVLSRTDAKFCDECGKPVNDPPPPTTPR